MITLDEKKPQWKIVLEMLQAGSVTTAMFLNTYGLAAEYRRAISELRRKQYKIEATRVKKGLFVYRLNSYPATQKTPSN